MVPPLSERPVTDEDEEQFRRETAPRKYTLRRRWADYRAEVKARRPKGVKARVRAWMDADIVDWGIRTSITLLIIAGLYALYTNGVTNGWWPAWGERPTVAATTTPPINPTPSASATASGEAAMSGGYQIGPDGILVRPAEHAASTYTKPELPEEAKQNTERGAELAAEYLLDTLTYAWNTGDTQLFEDITESGDNFRETYIHNVNELYSHGWMYDNSSTLTRIVSVEPVTDPKWNAQPNTIGVVFNVVTSNGTSCVNKRIITSNEFNVSVIFFMTWKDGRWVATRGEVLHDAQE
mgnify:CR=1 FL=1